MSIKNLVEMIKRNGLLTSMPQLEELYQVAIENELKLAESQREFRAADATIENLQMQVEKLAAENSGLKSDQVRIFNSGYQRGHEATVEGYYVDIHQNDMTTYHEDIVAEIAEEQTPQTDTFLAEVRAQGVEMFGQYHNFSEKLFIQKEAKKFATKLRREAAQ